MKILAEIRKTLAALGVLVGTIANVAAQGHVTAANGVPVLLAAAGVVAVFSLKNATRVEDVVAEAEKLGLLAGAGAAPTTTGSDTLDLGDGPAITIGGPEPASRAN